MPPLRLVAMCAVIVSTQQFGPAQLGSSWDGTNVDCSGCQCGDYCDDGAWVVGPHHAKGATDWFSPGQACNPEQDGLGCSCRCRHSGGDYGTDCGGAACCHGTEIGEVSEFHCP
ncbi:hypothetical protein EMIHUDRAFT_209982 [Emiliania huxleyi CCMP1516]|uniref:Uncharacterized protein n=2 Tax=Emiliania huxleyi TaxID=2903 RepID=A0A0D3J1F6_EMIH1|nr:hypothetical protein EMIHUDRAFT_209982 [Emiliania huxleyi CCMP1516]EOD17341.1 hypothetical protein EMIHUDRAFT_209982 [Emiliania huxleyi CCMP1516]|eukprot:XP_005769770.1 hypothetical protein EMIHUDRAFT_209982 [Emiliania huxleyi CCMP1516]